MTLILPQIGLPHSAGIIHDWSFVGKATASATTITIPSDAQEGDLCVLFDTALGQTPSAPTGFTMIASSNAVLDGTFSYRQLGVGEGGTTITGMAGHANYRVKVMVVIRPNVDVTITSGTFQGTMSTDGDPPEITVNTTAMSNSGVAIGIARALNSNVTTTGGGDWAGNIAAQSNGNLSSKMYYSLQTFGGLTNPSLDMTDQGSWNSLGGVYFEGTPT